MINRIGYACINQNLKPRGFKECRLNSVYKYGINYLREKIINNLLLTKDILVWNIENDIFMYRVTSKLMPLVTHPDILKDFDWRWQEDKEILEYMGAIKDIVDINKIRLSMHPDQFTVINSLKENVVKNSIDNLRYHHDVLKSLGGTDIIIHTGGVYGNKKASMERFIRNFNELDYSIQQMIRLENDDVSYNVDDVLYINSKTSVPIVLDIHHHRCNHDNDLMKEDIIKINETWNRAGITPKLHISSGKEGINDRKHSDYITNEDFESLLELVGGIQADLMVEAKEKDNATLKLLQHYSFCK
jgi:UV DNA damage endonuclease